MIYNTNLISNNLLQILTEDCTFLPDIYSYKAPANNVLSQEALQIYLWRKQDYTVGFWISKITISPDFLYLNKISVQVTTEVLLNLYKKLSLYAALESNLQKKIESGITKLYVSTLINFVVNLKESLSHIN